MLRCWAGLPGSNLFEVCTHNDHYIRYTPGQPFSINPGDGPDFVGIPVDQRLKKSDPPTTVIKWPRRLVFSGTGSRLKVRQEAKPVVLHTIQYLLRRRLSSADQIFLLRSFRMLMRYLDKTLCVLPN